MKRRFRRRRGEKGGGMVVLIQRYAQTLIAVVMAGGLLFAGVNHFATAADVEQKFHKIQNKIDTTRQEDRKERIENELFRLRKEKHSRENDALIKRYEQQLNDADNRLRELEKESRAQK